MRRTFPALLSNMTLRVAATGMATVLLACSQADTPSWQDLLEDASGDLTVTVGPWHSTPSFVRTQIDARRSETLGLSGMSLGYALGSRYEDVFGLDDGRDQLQFEGENTDRLGMAHIRFAQTYRGLPVYGSNIVFHVTSVDQTLRAITNGLTPDLRLRNVRARIRAQDAVAKARRRQSTALVDSVRLVIYPGRLPEPEPRVAWLVALRDDDAPLRELVFIDARDGKRLDIIDQVYYERNRRTHSAGNGSALPGKLKRGERDAKTDDADVDNAHEFIGETYDYFFSTHGRDSYDGRGAALTSTVHYRLNFPNAFWNGTQMAYGDGFAVKDVAAHELTHAVTEHSARLEYRWQSGALNESFSDIFGAMVDRDDWLIGEDLPTGPIRNMKDPGQFNHPAHTNEWRAMCGDNEGVHINSGIHNKAFVTIAEEIGKDKAERIFYRSLTVYLQTRATFEDSHAGALQSATDLFGEDSPEVKAVDQGFTAVGVDGSFNPGSSGCGGSPSDTMNLLWIALALVLGFIGAATTLGGHWRIDD